MAKYINTYHCYGFADVSTDGLFIGMFCLILFNVGVLSNAHRVLTQTRLFSRDVP